ncbi:MAG: hypothetical protein WC975_16720 [Phycisphaerae bacterium]
MRRRRACGRNLNGTYVMHMTSHYVGYVPTRQAFEYSGGHVTSLSTWSPKKRRGSDFLPIRLDCEGGS